jgi:hypothetical protein
VPRPKSPAGGWEAQNQRLTFYCPTDLERAIEAAMVATKRSKTQVIVDALRAQLDVPTDAEEATA